MSPEHAAALPVAGVTALQALRRANVEAGVRVLVNGAAGMVIPRNGVVLSIASVIVRNGKIAELDFLADPERLARLDVTILDSLN